MSENTENKQEGYKVNLPALFKNVSCDFVEFIINKKGLPLKNYKGQREKLVELFHEFVTGSSVKAGNAKPESEHFANKSL